MAIVAPFLSVVIPTDGRREELIDAVRSVVADSGDIAVEIIVVSDGTPTEIVEKAAAIDECVKVVRLPLALGASSARAAGIARASGSMIAFLDDDDLWLAGRTALLELFAGRERLVLAGCVRRRTPEAVDVVPSRAPGAKEHLSEFLFSRGFRYEANFLQTSGLAASADVAREVGFAALLPRHHDYDFVLRAVYGHRAEFQFLDAVVAEWRVEQARGSAFRHPSWQASQAWCLANAGLFSPRGRGSFLICVAARAAALQACRRGAWSCLLAAIRQGRPSLTEVLLGLYWTVLGRRGVRH